MAKDVFGEAVFTLEADASKLTSGLKKAEQVTKTSTAKMAADMSRVSSAMNQTTAAAGNTAGALGLVSSSAAVMGGTLGGTVSQIAGVTAAVNSLTAGNVGVAASFKVVGASVKSALPILIPIALTIAALTAIWKSWTSATKIQTDAEEESLAITERLNKRIVERQKVTKLAVKALEDRIKLAKGAKASDLLAEGPVKQLQLELERIGRVAKHREVLAAVKKRRQDDEKRRQEELLNIEKQRVQEVERLAMAEFKARRAAGRARESGQAPAETAREARVAALTAAGAIRDTERSTRLMLQALTQLVTEGSISVATARSISGLAPGETAAGGITGGRVGGAVAASSFAGGAGVVSASPAVKMNKILETVAKQSKEQVDLLKVIAEKDGSPGP